MQRAGHVLTGYLDLRPQSEATWTVGLVLRDELGNGRLRKVETVTSTSDAPHPDDGLYLACFLALEEAVLLEAYEVRLHLSAAFSPLDLTFRQPGDSPLAADYVVRIRELCSAMDAVTTRILEAGEGNPARDLLDASG